MKDYRLSEIKAICESHQTYPFHRCEECEIREECRGFSKVCPSNWKIEESKDDKQRMVE